MSIESIVKVLNLTDKRLTPVQRLLLIGIANHDSDGGAWPSKATLARYAGVGDEVVRSNLRKLEALGYVTTEVNSGGNDKTRSDRRPNRYNLHFNGAPPGGGPSSEQRDPTRTVNGAPPGAVTTPHPVGPETLLEPSLEPSFVPYTPSNGFDTFWARYPRREGKQDAVRAWKRALQRTPTATIIRGLTARVGWWQASETPKQFIPLPATWLNGERWNDELGPPRRDRRPGERPSAIEQLEAMRFDDDGNLLGMVDEHGKLVG